MQSLILGALLIALSAALFLAGIIADLIAVNRRLLERLQMMIFSQGKGSSGEGDDQVRKP